MPPWHTLALSGHLRVLPHSVGMSPFTITGTSRKGQVPGHDLVFLDEGGGSVANEQTLVCEPSNRLYSITYEVRTSSSRFLVDKFLKICCFRHLKRVEEIKLTSVK